MTRLAKLISRSACLTIVVLMAVAGLTSRQAQAQACCANDIPDGVTDFFVLYTGDPHNLIFTNSNANGNAGIGDDGGFVGSGAGTITGTVEFAATSGLYSPDGITVTGDASFGNTNVQSNLDALFVISQTLGDEEGAPLDISAGGSVSASSGIFDGKNRVFTASVDSDFIAGTTFTINATNADFVVINIPPDPEADAIEFDGSIVLAGGIASDHVLINFFGGVPGSHSGGPSLTIDTDGNTTSGIFLDPNGDFHITSSVLHGRIFGGDSLDSSITDSTIVADPPFRTPEPASLALLGAGLGVLGIIRGRRRPLVRP